MGFNISEESLKVAYLNIHGQTGLDICKQNQIAYILMKHDIDILNCQEINIDINSFKQPSILSSYNIIQNNAINKYGTAVLVKNHLNVENIRNDTQGRVIAFDIENLTFANVYLQSGTDGLSRQQRETMISERLPQLLVNRKDSGIIGGDFNCILKAEDSLNHPESKISPSLRRFIKLFNLTDSFRFLHPHQKVFSRYFNINGQNGATRIDRSYHWGGVAPSAGWYESVAFSDHLMYIVKLTIPNTMQKILSPKSRPFFKIKPEIIQDDKFKTDLQTAMIRWKEVKQAGLNILDWWELVVKPGIRRLGLSRSKEIKREKRGKLNMLMLRQSFHTRKLQEGSLDHLGCLRKVQLEIVEWYEEESKKVTIQSRVDDIQESEKISIFHHEQHQKFIKRSAILKLDTVEKGILRGHRDCSTYLEKQVADLLLRPAVLSQTAQATLLSEVEEVFTREDIAMLEKEPSIEEVKNIVFDSNLNAAPGTDGLTSLLYRNHWEILGESLYEVINEIMKGSNLTSSQRTSLMIFSCKPKKMNSFLPSDKRRLSLMNSDFKLVSGVYAARFRKTLTHTLSPYQLVSGDDRRIHHGINKARDCIQAVTKSKTGCALLDLDFVAAFDYTVFEWVFMVLQKKGLPETVINRIRNVYQNRISIPVINNVPGQGMKNIRGTLAQGCPSSMNWFSFAIDPLLTYLHKRLQGIPIISLPVLGPKEKDKPNPEKLVEKYKVYGLADDVKPSVSCMAEFALVDKAAALFEQSSGNVLHRDPGKGKCKVLLLGRWRGTVTQEDIRLPHFQITNSLAFVGVQLQATWLQTRKENNDQLVSRVKEKLGSWKSGKFMPLVSRPFSVNSYGLSKIWFRAHSVDLRAGDISTITSLCKSYIYQDMLEKPNELVLFRKVQDGGLGLHNIECKAMALLITTFLQTAANPRFQQSLYHNCLFRYYCLGDDSLDKPSMPPYYSEAFFNTIKKVVDNSPLNPVHMTSKQWYTYLLEEKVTMEEMDEEGRRQLKKCRIEILYPDIDWQKSYQLCRLRGLSTEIRSFCFKLIHQILPFRDRTSQLMRNNNSQCQLCNQNSTETPLHGLFLCSRNNEAAELILAYTRPFDPTITAEKILKLDINVSDRIYELPTTLIAATGLYQIWENRKNKKGTAPYQIRAELECLISLLRRARSRKCRETGNMIENTLQNFHYY